MCESLRNCLHVRRVNRRCRHELRERVAARLRVVRRTREGVKHHARLVVFRERRAILYAHERIADHHLAHRLVGKARAAQVLRLVRIVRRRLKCAQEIAGVDNDARAADLTETE